MHERFAFNIISVSKLVLSSRIFFSEWDTICKMQSIISHSELLDLVAFHWRFLHSRRAYLFTVRYAIESRSSAQSNSDYLRSTQSIQYTHAGMKRGWKKSSAAFANNSLLTQEAIICIMSWILNSRDFAHVEITGRFSYKMRYMSVSKYR